MSDLDEVWNMSNVTNTNRTTIKNNSLANSSFPRNKLGPSYAPYTQEEVSGVGNEETTQLGYRYVNPDGLVYDQTNNIGYPLQSGCNPMVPYQPKNAYSTTLGMAPAVITPEYLNTLFSNEYFLKLLAGHPPVFLTLLKFIRILFSTTSTNSTTNPHAVCEKFKLSHSSGVVLFATLTV